MEKSKRSAVGVAVIWLGRLAVLAAILAFWQFGVSSGLLAQISFGKPADVVRQLGTDLSSWSTVVNVGLTVEEALLGFAIGASLAIAVVLCFALWPILGEALVSIFGIFNSIPRMSLAPLLVLWFGLGLMPKVVLVTTVVFFVVFFNLVGGMSTIDGTMLANLRVQGANKWEMVVHLYLPASFGWLISGLRTSVGFAFASAVVAEYIGATKGLGYVIFFGLARYSPAEAFAGIIIMIAMVLVVTGLVELVRRRFKHWEITYNGT